MQWEIKLHLLSNNSTLHKKSIIGPNINKDMVLAIKNGDKQEMSLLYDAYAPAMYGRILTIIPDKGKADSILASIFLDLSHTIKKYNAEAISLFTWLLNLATNKSIEALNTFPVKQDVKESSSQINEVSMNTYINKLSRFERTVFSHIYFRGFDVNEITRLLHLPEKLVKKRFKLLHKFKRK